MKRLTGSEITIRLLERQGVHTVAGIPGGANLPLYDALSRSQKIRHVLARHEQGAGFIAQGMARVSGIPGVCLASSGPGATNLLTAIADAKLDSIPLVAITGQVSRAMLGTDAFQEVDTYGLSIPITKHNFLVLSAEELLDVIPRAFRIASSGRPGPVLIDIPKDVQNERISVEQWPDPGRRDSVPNVSADQISAAADLINESSKPILYLGGGVVHSGAGKVAQAFAEGAALPTVMTLMALGVVPVDHALSLGMLGMHGAPYANHLLEECDLLIVVGARFDDRATGNLSRFCPRARVVHIDVDSAELNKLRFAQVGITGDVEGVLTELSVRTGRRSREHWLRRVNELRRHHPMRLPGIECPRSHYGLIAAVHACLDDRAIITTDVGQHQMWVAQSYPLRRPRQWLTSGGLGTMGFGLPAAIGAALAEPTRTVVCFSGDGSILMNVQELTTLADTNGNVKVIVMNNRALGLVRQQQTLFYEGRIFESRFKQVPDFVSVAKAFGVSAVDLDSCIDPLQSLRHALQKRGPCVIHSSIDENENVFPMVPPGAANTEMIGA